MVSQSLKSSTTTLELHGEDWINIFEPKENEGFKKLSNVSETGKRNWGGCCSSFIMFLVPPVVLASIIATQIGFVLLTDHANNPLISDEDEPTSGSTTFNLKLDQPVDLQTLASTYAWILIVLVAPALYNSIFSLMVSSTREMKYPSKPFVAWALLSGLMEGIGMSILGAAVLPRLSLLSGISVLLAIVPASSCGEFFQRNLASRSQRSLLALAIFLAAGALGAMVFFTKDITLAYLLPISLLCIGSTFWLKNAPLKLKQLKCYYYLGFLRSFIQIPTVLLSVWIVWILTGNDITSLWTLGFTALFSEQVNYIAAVCIIVGSFIGFHFGWMACSLCFQKIGFAAPLALSSIISFAAVTGVCLGTSENCVELSDIYWEIPIFLGLYILQVIICRHVWYENIFPIPLSKALWTRTGYSSLGTEQCLLLNRREKALRFKIKRNQSEESLPSILTNDSGSSGFETGDCRTINSCTTKDETNYVFMCTTMWHENHKEMHHLVASFLRIDSGCTETSEKTVYEGHVLFDDAFEPEGGAYNEYVNLFISLLPKDIPSITEKATPFGCQLLITLPHGTQIYVHLKDKKKIRNKKRWSQIMYMFYILRFRVLTNGLDINNVFILTTDGDTEFDMPSTRDLLLYLKRNHIVGGVCSRVFPKGGGPVAWFQVFEYAVGHWLQKAAENVLGSVLCLPGCFSMLRGSAVEEVMHTYTTNAITGKEFLQYDQGEDRWLSTLLLKHGWLLQYAASADAYTYCPSTFHEFYNQRRRWVSSTIANLADLIMNSEAVVKKNISISRFFMAYQALLLMGTIISPGIILMMMGAGLNAGFGVNQTWVSLSLLVLSIIYALICLKTTSDTQIKIAWVLSLLGGIIMIFVMVGFVVTVADDPTTLSSGFVLFLVGTMVFTAIIHPREAYCLIAGIVYLFALPSVFIFLMIYSIANIDNVSWGTREGKLAEANQKNGNKIENARRVLARMKFWKKEEPENAKKEEEQSMLPTSESCLDIADEKKDYLNVFPEKRRLSFGRSSTSPMGGETKEDFAAYQQSQHINNNNNDHDSLHEFQKVDHTEYTFWELLIGKYLEVEKPTKANLLKKAQILEMLKELRNASLFSFLLINCITVFIFLAVFGQESLIVLDSSAITLLLSIFAVMILFQFVAMIWHRLSTVMHVVATNNKYTQDKKRKGRQERRVKRDGKKVEKKERNQNRNKSNQVAPVKQMVTIEIGDDNSNNPEETDDFSNQFLEAPVATLESESTASESRDISPIASPNVDKNSKDLSHSQKLDNFSSQFLHSNDSFIPNDDQIQVYSVA